MQGDAGGAARDAGTARATIPWFGILLALMILAVMIAPIFASRYVGAVAMGLILTAAATAIGIRGAGAFVVAASIAAIAAEQVFATVPAVLLALALRTVFLCYVEVRLLLHVLGDREVTHESVSAVACGYVMIGLVWGGLYAILETLEPGSFNVPATWGGGPSGSVQALNYFSFIILSTLGLGDITPAGPPAGGLCVGEVIIGQLYLAIMIARMVGIVAARHPR